MKLFQVRWDVLGRNMAQDFLDRFEAIENWNDITSYEGVVDRGLHEVDKEYREGVYQLES